LSWSTSTFFAFEVFGVPLNHISGGPEFAALISTTFPSEVSKVDRQATVKTCI
jgi:hypothetical protein